MRLPVRRRSRGIELCAPLDLSAKEGVERIPHKPRRGQKPSAGTSRSGTSPGRRHAESDPDGGTAHAKAPTGLRAFYQKEIEAGEASAKTLMTKVIESRTAKKKPARRCEHG